MTFANKNILITGGSRGIGLATSIGFAKLGANVAITYRSNEAAAMEACAKIEVEGVRSLAVKLETTDERGHAELIGRIVSEWGSLDVVVANAGIWRGAAIDEMTMEDYREMMEINMTGTFVLAKHTARVMKQQGSGAIVIVSSTAGQRGESGHSHYAASKGAQISFTKSIAVELAPHGIRVNCVAPGWVETDMTRSAMSTPEDMRKISETIPLGRPAKPEEIANAILFLASPMASAITGEILNVNGGSVLCG